MSVGSHFTRARFKGSKKRKAFLTICPVQKGNRRAYHDWFHVEPETDAKKKKRFLQSIKRSFLSETGPFGSVPTFEADRKPTTRAKI